MPTRSTRSVSTTFFCWTRATKPKIWKLSVAKLTALEEFKSQKEELLAKLGTLQEQIDFLEEDHKNKLNDIEKKVIIDKDR